MAEKECIEREAAVNAILNLAPKVDADGYCWVIRGDVARAIDSIPAADVRPVVRGQWGYRWKFHGDGRRPTELFPCSECGYDNASATNFCPNCGADMREENDG